MAASIIRTRMTLLPTQFVPEKMGRIVSAKVSSDRADSNRAANNPAVRDRSACGNLFLGGTARYR